MHPHADKTKRFIDQLKVTRAMATELLSDTPEFQTRAEHVIDTLANGLEFAIGGQRKAVEKPKTVGKQQSGRTIMGQPVPADKEPMQKQVADTQPSRSDVEKLRADVALAYEAFPNLSNKEIRNSLSNLEVLGVAKAAGMDISEGKDIKITDAYLNEIRVAMAEKAQHEADIAQADKDAAATKEAGTEPKAEGKAKTGK